MRIARRGQDGATTAEYVVVVAMVTLLVGALSVTSVPRSIHTATRAAFCFVAKQVGAATCGTTDPDTPGNPHEPNTPPPPTCRVSSTTESLGGGITVFSVDLGVKGSIQVVKVRRGNEEYYLVVPRLQGEAGAKASVGVEAELAKLGLKVTRSGEAGSNMTGGMSPTWRFDNEADARAFAEQTRKLVTGMGEDTLSWKTLIPIWGPARIPINQVKRVSNYRPGLPSSVRMDLGRKNTGKLSLSGGPASAGVAQSLGAVVGADVQLRSEGGKQAGDQTYFIQLNAQLAAELGLGVTGQSGLQGNVGVAVTFGSDGTVKGLALSHSVTGSAGADWSKSTLLGAKEGMNGPLGNVKDKFGLRAGAQGTHTLEASVNFDLSDPNLRAAAQRFFAALQKGDRNAAAAAGKQLVNHGVEHSDILLTHHTGTQSNVDASVQGGYAGLTFGGRFNTSASSRALQHSAWRPGGHGWQYNAC